MSQTIRYYATIRGEERIVEVDDPGDGALRVRLDGTPVEVDLTSLDGNGLHSLLVDGHSREMVLSRDGDTTSVSLDGQRIDVLVQDEVSRALSAIAGPAGTGPSEVVAPMPGVVVSIPVAAGDAIEEGQPVIVVEAMKMQNELCAEAAGIVDRIAVAVGDSVDGGDVLAVLKPKDDA